MGSRDPNPGTLIWNAGVLLFFVLFKTCVLLYSEGRMRVSGWERAPIPPSLVCFPNASNSQGQARLRPRARTSIWAYRVVAGAGVLRPSFTAS